MRYETAISRIRLLGFKWEEVDFIIAAYNEIHRYYHNWGHILTMIEWAEEKDILDDNLFLAIIFHDLIYDPKREDNEEKSANVFLSMAKENEGYDIKRIFDAIISTKDHKSTDDKLTSDLILLDLLIFKAGISGQIQFEKDIFKEYQFVDWSIYKQKRLTLLDHFQANSSHYNYVRFFEPKIGVFAGSFNPFHLGHLNILEKAEKIFDKVIIARGKNPEKTNFKEPLPEIIHNRQIEYYDRLLTDFLKSLSYPVTLIRGLRDANDLLYESNQICFLKEFMPELNIVEILCDKEYNHISSSAIRSLKMYNVDLVNKYTLKD